MRVQACAGERGSSTCKVARMEQNSELRAPSFTCTGILLVGAVNRGVAFSGCRHLDFDILQVHSVQGGDRIWRLGDSQSGARSSSDFLSSQEAFEVF